ncbi:MAG: outer membrane lipoprotein carrier protein LolA [Nitrospirota bacterium]
MKKFSFLFVAIFLMSVSLGASSLDEEIQRIQKAYEKIKDMKGDFTQRSHIKDLKRVDTYKGLFFIKVPMKMKLEYKGENGQEVFLKDNQIIIYQKKERQALKSKFDRNTYGQAPVALLGGFGRIQEEFNISKKNNKLILTPKVPVEGIQFIEIEPSREGFPISSFTIYDPHSDRIEIKLKDVEVNTGLKDSLFEFSLPKGVNIFEHNF